MILLILAAASLLQPADEAAPPALVQAGDAWSQCIADGIDGVADTVAPRTAARTILGQCRPLQERMVAAHSAWIDASSLSAAAKSEARAETQRSIAAIEGQVVQAIRAARADD